MPAISFTSLSLSSAVAACLGLAGSFVLSLYLADVGLPRDNPVTIRRRVFAVTMVTLSSPLLLVLLSDSPFDMSSMLLTLGFKYQGLFRALLVPITLVLILYTGPLLQHVTSRGGMNNPLQGERNDIVLRNYIIAPLVEEIVFRSCMLPIVRPHLGDVMSVIITPLFFGIAHVHHMLEHFRQGTMSIKSSFLNVLLQTTYTSIFGMFSAYLFVRTGHVTGAILAHSLCNMLGLPEVWTLPQHKHRYLVGVAYIGGLVGFIYFLPRWTDPGYY